MIEIAVVFAILALVLAFFFRGGQKQPVVEEEVEIESKPSSQDEAPEQEEEEEEVKKEVAAPAKQGKSFKKLKQMSKKFKKGAAGPDPTHSAFLLGLKGIHSSLVDIDFVETDQRLFAICAEQSGQLTAYALIQDSETALPRVISKNLKFEGGLKFTSASLSMIKGTAGETSRDISLAEERALPIKFIVAVSCFDHCQIQVLQATFHQEKFTFSPVQNTLMNVHTMPVGKIRLSKQFPRLLVTCGYEKDVYLKLWNATAKQEDGKPAKCIHQLTTSQLKHKQMAQMSDIDIYAVAASTSEVKLIQVVTGSGKGPQAGTTMLSKSQTLIDHRREAIAISFNKDICATIAADNQVVITRITGAQAQFRSVKTLFKKEFTAEEGNPISENSCIAVKKIEKMQASQQEQIYFAISDSAGGFAVWHLGLDARGESITSGPTVVLKVDEAHNSEVLSLMQFVQLRDESYLTTGARLDQRVNLWRI